MVYLGPCVCICVTRMCCISMPFNMFPTLCLSLLPIDVPIFPLLWAFGEVKSILMRIRSSYLTSPTRGPLCLQTFLVLVVLCCWQLSVHLEASSIGDLRLMLSFKKIHSQACKVFRGCLVETLCRTAEPQSCCCHVDSRAVPDLEEGWSSELCP